MLTATGTATKTKVLLTSLISYWKLDETSGTRNDSVGTNHLTDNNTVTSTTGVVNNSAVFTAANSESLSVASNASVKTGDISFTWAVWVKLTTKTASSVLISKDKETSGDREYRLLYQQASDRFRCLVFRGDADSTALNATTFGSPSTATWYLVMFWYDSSLDTLYIQVNNGTVDSVAAAGPLQTGAAPLRFGAADFTGAEAYADAQMDEVQFWKRILTSAERAEVYNNPDWYHEV